MMAIAPAPEVLLDHRGNPRASFEMSLSYEQARLGTAFHEAGHAVLAMAYGVHVVTSEVIAWSPETDRWSLTGNTAFEARDTKPWHFAAQCAAGEIANVQYLMTYGLWTPERALACSADHDREQAIDVLADFGYDLGRDHTPDRRKSWGMVRGMARRKIGYLWREIRTVALAMDERTVLTGDDIAALTGMTNSPRQGDAA
ncbi:hypothetical protein ACFT7S_14065 [Streptomyces sp. NPDC057136]|uniref:hypothetical protein n=1 Tax=Streptomyces sp. NPDC057136 TaxID=3346029 RepID=UPI00362CC15F